MACRSRSRRNFIALCSVALGLIGASGAPIVFESMTGDPVALELVDDELGLVVHFWATWCPSCIRELADLEAAAKSCGDGRVRVVTVNVGEEVDQITEYTAQLGLDLPVLRDVRGEVWRDLSGVGLPINLIWTPRDRRVEVGPHDQAQWTEILRTLGCEAGP